MVTGWDARAFDGKCGRVGTVNVWSGSECGDGDAAPRDAGGGLGAAGDGRRVLGSLVSSTPVGGTMSRPDAGGARATDDGGVDGVPAALVDGVRAATGVRCSAGRDP